MNPHLRTHATTLTISLFAASAISGVALFFHLAPAAFHAMHEWLSMVWLVPVVLHVWRNWPAFKSYFWRKTVAVPAILSLAAALVFAYPAITSQSSGGNPTRAAITAIQNGTVAEVAPLFDLSADALSARLVAKGYTVTRADQTLDEIATASGKGGGPGLVADVAFP
ncbi:DUF4405 domain-containing protein [Rhodospirillaceae bacterium KN72]|uniref:DUF4405 domain-containing protein n=1 Tax=Pacificispira spongiicola TaxID=2729598 RepID=A0A7Y0DXK4_9PROT|nr:DUF4405 domain-containing protein [Pacificispira spongiicola]NMM43457.1 DUF4405 domain-containing protein [Pacificispira spongiicola]